MINAMFATDEIGGMGFDGKLPWPHNREDMLWFKSHTVGDVVVMGSKTWEGGMPKPLPGRVNWVVTRDMDKKFPGSDGVWYGSPKDLCWQLASVHKDKNIWVIGGAFLLLSMQGFFDRIYHTSIKGVYQSDTSIEPSVLITDRYKRIYHDDSNDKTEFNIYAKLP